SGLPFQTVYRIIVPYASNSTQLFPFFSFQALVVLGIRNDITSSEKEKSVLLEYCPLIAIPVFAVANVLYYVRQGKRWWEAFRVRTSLASSSIAPSKTAKTISKIHPETENVKNGTFRGKF
ncbi:hypothetical protein COOONC_13556, partial [Cooperia oncophora]